MISQAHVVWPGGTFIPPDVELAGTQLPVGPPTEPSSHIQFAMPGCGPQSIGPQIGVHWPVDGSHCESGGHIVVPPIAATPGLQAGAGHAAPTGTHVPPLA